MCFYVSLIYYAIQEFCHFLTLIIFLVMLYCTPFLFFFFFISVQVKNFVVIYVLFAVLIHSFLIKFFLHFSEIIVSPTFMPYLRSHFVVIKKWWCHLELHKEKNLAKNMHCQLQIYQKMFSQILVYIKMLHLKNLVGQTNVSRDIYVIAVINFVGTYQLSGPWKHEQLSPKKFYKIKSSSCNTQSIIIHVYTTVCNKTSLTIDRGKRQRKVIKYFDTVKQNIGCHNSMFITFLPNWFNH